jgi:hypothetical protein
MGCSSGWCGDSRRPSRPSTTLPQVIPPGPGYGTISDVPTIRFAQDDADELLGRDPLALTIGRLLDQHMGQRSSWSLVEGRADG